MRRTTRFAWTLFSALLASSLLGPASAQLPPAGGEAEEFFGAFTVQSTVGIIETDFLNRATAELVVTDLSYTQYEQVHPASASKPIQLRAEVTTENRQGWVASVSPSTIPNSRGGDVHRAELVVLHDPSIVEDVVQIRVIGEMLTPNGTLVQETYVYTQIRPFYGFFTAQSRALPRLATPYDRLTYPVEIRNAGLFIDTFTLDVSVPDDKWLAAAPASITLQPKETRLVNVTILTPAYQLYEPYGSAIVTVAVRSAFDGSNVMFVPLVVTYAGVYVPPAWWPSLSLFFVVVGLLAVRRREGRTRRRLEEGAPLDPAKRPDEVVRLAALAVEDPDAHARRKAELATLFAGWRKEFRAHRRQRLRQEAEVERAERSRYREIRRLRRVRARQEREARARVAKEEREKRKAVMVEARRLDADAQSAAKARARDLKAEAKRLGQEQKRATKAAAKERTRLGKERGEALARLEKEKAKRLKDLRKKRGKGGAPEEKA